MLFLHFSRKFHAHRLFRFGRGAHRGGNRAVYSLFRKGNEGRGRASALGDFVLFRDSPHRAAGAFADPARWQAVFFLTGCVGSSVFQCWLADMTEKASP